MRIFAFISMFGLVAGSFAPLHAQSLVDVAKKEGERRQTVKGTTKVYTNGDLKPVSPAPDPSTAAADDTSSSAEKKSADTKADTKSDSGAETGDGKATPASSAAAGSEQGQEYWNSKMHVLNEQLERDRLYAEAIQTRINSLTADFSGKDDPAQRTLIAEDREKAVSELSRLRKQIEEDKDAIGNLEEEARHAGVPPGWLR